MFKIIGRTPLRIFCLSENGAEGEVFELPVLHRKYVSYWTFLQKYPPDPNWRIKYFNQHIFDGKLRTVGRPHLGSKTIRRSRWSK